MKVSDFLTQAWLNGADNDPSKRRQLMVLQQQFSDNELAEVQACYRGLLVFNRHNQYERNAMWTTGSLHLVDYNGKVVDLVDEESEDKVMDLARIFLKEGKYFYNEHGPEAFRKAYLNGEFEDDPSSDK